jgi:hypothetical protein
VGFLSANKYPLRNHETILVFGKGSGIYNPQKTQGKPYIQKQHAPTDIYNMPMEKDGSQIGNYDKKQVTLF